MIKKIIINQSKLIIDLEIILKNIHKKNIIL